MTTIYISDSNQLKPGLDLRTAMQEAEELTGASSPGGTGASTYVDGDGKQIQPVVIWGKDASGADCAVFLVPPGAHTPNINGANKVVVVLPLTTSQDLEELPTLAGEINVAGSVANVGSVKLVAATVAGSGN